MLERTEREVLGRVLTRAQRGMWLRAAMSRLARRGPWLLGIGAVLIAADQRWNHGRASGWVGILSPSIALLWSFVPAWWGMGSKVRSAIRLDREAQLKDRVSSACEFLELGRLEEAQETQIHDAARHARSLDCRRLFRVEWRDWAPRVCATLLLFALSFLVPPLVPPGRALVAPDALKETQLDGLRELRQELETRREMREAIEKLEQIARRFERNEIGQREVMLELGRLDEWLRARALELGVENLESEMRTLVPHLASQAATAETAKALREQKYDQAARELEKLGERADRIDPADRKKLAAHLGGAAAKLGKRDSTDSVGGDLARASECLEKSDSKGFEGAVKNMGRKLELLSKSKTLQRGSRQIGLCKASLGRCEEGQPGDAEGPKFQSQSQGKGGLQAGKSGGGDPLGNASRLKDGYRRALQISGQAGQGPVESETETVEGQISHSRLGLREAHADYAAVAEQAVDREDIPLSRRYHVKRYFQAIRPTE